MSTDHYLLLDLLSYPVSEAQRPLSHQYPSSGGPPSGSPNNRRVDNDMRPVRWVNWAIIASRSADCDDGIVKFAGHGAPVSRPPGVANMRRTISHVHK